MRDPLALVPAELTRVLGRDPGVHHARPIGRRRQQGPRLWRVWGDSFSFVLKVHSTVDGSETPHNWQYWRREAEAYASGLTEYAYAGSGLTAPVLMSRMDRTDGTVALWLEDVPETPTAQLGVRWAGEVARRLGLAQAAYLGARAVPALPWLSRRWLRQYVAHTQPETGGPLDDDAFWAQSVVRTEWNGLRHGLTALRTDRRAMLRAVESLPRTLCHLHLSPHTVLASGSRCVLVDWGYCGVGAVGEDAGALVADFVLNGAHHVDELSVLEDAVWQGYLGGLREGGWTGDERLPRLGMTAAAAVRYNVVANGAPALVRGGARTLPVRVETWFRTTGALLGRLLEWWEEAAGVVRELGPARPYPRP